MTLPRLCGAGIYAFLLGACDSSFLHDVTVPEPADVTAKTLETTIESARAALTDLLPDGSTTTRETTVTFEMRCTPKGCSLECSLDGSPFEACVSPVEYTSLEDGQHEFQTRAANSDGEFDPTPATRQWHVDTVAPETVIETGPAEHTAETSATFTFVSPTQVDATFECNLDGAGFTPCASPKEYAALEDDTHHFEVRAVDLAGNVDPTPSEWDWIQETDAPIVTITAEPPAYSSQTSATFAFTCSETCTFECELDGNGFSACSSPKTYDGLADRSYIFKVHAHDASNLLSANEPVRNWTVDTVPPNTTIDTGPDPVSGRDEATFTYSCNDLNCSADLECRLDGGAFTACPASFTGLTDGLHTVEVRAFDLAGNTDASPASYTFRVDTTAPESSFDASPSAFSNTGSPTFTFSCVDATSCTYECDLDEAGYVPCTTAGLLVGLDDGEHTLTIRATDEAGNVESASLPKHTWTIDTVGPDITIDTGPAATTASQNATFTFHCDDATSCSYTCSIDGGAFQACTSPISYSALSYPTDHSFVLHATDQAGNPQQAEDSWAWHVGRSWTQIVAANAADTSSIKGHPHTCGIANGQLFCWGNDTNGQLGLNSATTETCNSEDCASHLARVGTASNWRSVSTGAFYGTAVASVTCGVKTDNTLYCWGDDSRNQLGTPSSSASLDEPAQVCPSPPCSPTDARWSMVSTSGTHTCGIETDGELWCWGPNQWGELGNGVNPSCYPSCGAVLYRETNGFTDWVTVSTAHNFTCAIRGNHYMYCWGLGAYGTIGNGIGGVGVYVTVPTRVLKGAVAGSEDARWVDVSAGTNHACALDLDGKIWCWGAYEYGRLGGAPQTASGCTPYQCTNRPAEISANTTHSWAAVGSGRWHSCAVTTTGELYCWGTSYDGALGLGGTDLNNIPPTRVGTESNWADVTAGIHTCAYRSTGTPVSCWGHNAWGQLGVGTSGTTDTTYRFVPAPVTEVE